MPTPENSSGKTPVFQVLADDIKATGIECVFGLMSDDTALFATALDTAGVRLYGARHENMAIAAADGYAYTTGKLAIAIVGRGPALANGLHAAVYASRTNSKLLIIYGEAATGGAPNGLGPDYKALDGVGVLRAAGIRTFTVTSPEGARQTLADAIAAASAGNAVSLHLPTNVQLAEIDAPVAPLKIAAREQKPQTPTPQSIATAAAVLANAKKPLIVGGLGAHRAGARKAIEELAERIGGLLVTTARGKDLFRGNPRNLGIIGSFSHSIARRMADQADCVIAFGAGLNFLTTSFGTSVPQVPLIQIDAARANIGRWLNADVGIVGDARLAAEQLLAAVPERPASEKPFHSAESGKLIADFRPEQDFQPQNTPRTIDMRTLGLELEALLPANRNLVVDGGNFLGIVPYLSVPDPGAFKMISDFASIGLAFGAALGVARARPDRTTVMVVGDGGFLMTMGELETVVREDLPMIVVVMNDCAYGAELHFLKLRQQPVGKSVFPDVDYAPVAAAFGFEAETIRTVEDLRRIAPKLRNPEGPIFLDCKLNADVAAPFMSEFAHFEGH
jgi:thiamine pyrophosphate-dependent acetolactate synthase large subunit-like protein